MTMKKKRIAGGVLLALALVAWTGLAQAGDTHRLDLSGPPAKTSTLDLKGDTQDDVGLVQRGGRGGGFRGGFGGRGFAGRGFAGRGFHGGFHRGFHHHRFHHHRFHHRRFGHHRHFHHRHFHHRRG